MKCNICTLDAGEEVRWADVSEWNSCSETLQPFSCQAAAEGSRALAIQSWPNIVKDELFAAFTAVWFTPSYSSSFFFFYTAGSSFQPDPKEERRIFFWPHISHLPDYINVLPCLYWWPAALLTSIYWSVRLANETANTTQTNTPTTRILLNNTYECARRLARLHMDTQLLFTSSTCQIAQQLAVCLRMNLNNFVKF